MATEKEVQDALNFVDENDSLQGFEDLTTDTMAIPFVRLLQTLSPQVDEDSSDYIEGAKPGMFFNTVTNELYGKEIEVVVIKFEHIYIEWKPERGGLVGYHSPEHAEEIAADKTFGNWKTASGNQLQENFVYYVLIAGHEQEGVMILSMSSSALKEARKWNRRMRNHVMPNGKKALPYYLVWKLTSEKRSNDKGSWYGFDIDLSGYVTKELYLSAKEEQNLLPGKTVDYAQIADAREESQPAESDEDVDF